MSGISNELKDNELILFKPNKFLLNMYKKTVLLKYLKIWSDTDLKINWLT